MQVVTNIHDWADSRRSTVIAFRAPTQARRLKPEHFKALALAMQERYRGVSLPYGKSMQVFLQTEKAGPWPGAPFLDMRALKIADA